ncbi:MAG: hypothetical protein ACD_75C02409G0002 [uncultured bacterium]|nr:MAG: hypothetical protein ACD_75C02409G0002 [uncultured bacterium]
MPTGFHIDAILVKSLQGGADFPDQFDIGMVVLLDIGKGVDMNDRLPVTPFLGQQFHRIETDCYQKIASFDDLLLQVPSHEDPQRPGMIVRQRTLDFGCFEGRKIEPLHKLFQSPEHLSFCRSDAHPDDCHRGFCPTDPFQSRI